MKYLELTYTKTNKIHHTSKNKKQPLKKQQHQPHQYIKWQGSNRETKQHNSK